MTSRQIDCDDLRWLLSDAATGFLALAAQRSTTSVADIASLRKHLTAERAHLVFEQADLRRRAAVKFTDAERMFFTKRGLQQATGEVVARYKAQRFRRVAPIAPLRVVDLCCGIGGDLMALSERGPTQGVDLDRVMALFAAVNSGVGVTCQDALAIDLATFDAWHIDPDRRPSGGRTTQADLQRPTAEAINSLRNRCANVAIKLAPGGEAPPDWAEQAELEWISHQRECKQQLAWFGSLARGVGTRRATVLRGGQPPRSMVGFNHNPGESPMTIANRIGRYVHEPDAAVLAAGLIGTLAGEYQLEAVGRDVVYLTGDERIADPALATFEVTDVMPLRVKRLKTLLRERGIGRLEVKKRAVPHDPHQLRSQLRVSGEHRATLLVTRRGERVIAILARRVER